MLITVQDFLDNIDDYLKVKEVVKFGKCATCDSMSQYGVEYSIFVPETGERYKFSTVDSLEYLYFTKRSLLYWEGQTLKNFIEKLEITNDYDFMKKIKAVQPANEEDRWVGNDAYINTSILLLSPFFLPNKNTTGFWVGDIK